MIVKIINICEKLKTYRDMLRCMYFLAFSFEILYLGGEEKKITPKIKNDERQTHKLALDGDHVVTSFNYFPPFSTILIINIIIISILSI